MSEPLCKILPKRLLALGYVRIAFSSFQRASRIPSKPRHPHVGVTSYQGHGFSRAQSLHTSLAGNVPISIYGKELNFGWHALRGECSKPRRAWFGLTTRNSRLCTSYPRPSVVASLRFGQQLLSVPDRQTRSCGELCDSSTGR